MSRLTVAAASPADAQILAPNLRLADLAEIAAATGEKPVQALHRGIVASADPRVVLRSGTPIAVFGVVDRGGGVGSPWLLGSDAILAHWFEFARRSRDELDAIRTPWRVLENFVDARNEVHVRWLQWLGAELDGPHRHGILGLPFWRFSL